MKRRAFHFPLFLLMVLVMAGFTAQSENSSNTNHENAVCSDCHTLLTGVNAAAAPVNRSETCLQCHTSTTTASSILPFHNNSEKNCLDCHDFHNKQLLKAGDQTFEFDFDNQQLIGTCLSCHAASSSPANINGGHRQALEIYHSSTLQLQKLSPSESCLLCHSGSGYIYREMSASKPVPRFNEHTSHPVGVAIKQSSKRSEAVAERLIDGRLECQSCHNINSDQKYLLASNSTDAVNSLEFCFTCHADKKRSSENFFSKF